MEIQMGYIKNPSDNGQFWRESAANDSASVWHGFDSKNNGKDKFFKSETLPNNTKALSESGSIASSGNRLIAGVYGDQASLPASLWNPSLMTSVGWYDADDSSTITESAGAISQWDDKSGNDNHAVQGVGSKQPIYNASDPVFGGKPSILGVLGDYLETPSMSINRMYLTLYLDGVATAWPNHNAVVSGPSFRLTGRVGDVHVWDGPRDNKNFDFNGSTFRDGSTVDVNYDPTGLPMAGDIFRINAESTKTQVWRLMGNTQTYTTWHGGLAEVIFTDGSEDFNTQQKIEGYLAWKWGFVDKFPAEHPYKSAPPYIDAY
jgi:hypothetical protein